MSEWVKVGSAETINTAVYARDYGPNVRGEVFIDRVCDWAWVIIVDGYAVDNPLYESTPEAAKRACDEAFRRFAAAVKGAAEGV